MCPICGSTSRGVSMWSAPGCGVTTSTPCSPASTTTSCPRPRLERCHEIDPRLADDSRNGSNESFYWLPAVGRGMADLKTVTDTVHGTIRLEPLTLDLLETLELQRLNSIRQVGLTYLVFPGANHSRVEHCLGVGHVAGEMAKALDLSPDERKLVKAAGLLHDVGHGPFSHTLEHVLRRALAVDHMPRMHRTITGADDH